MGNGLPPATNAPDLRSVEALSSDLLDGALEQAKFCFDANISTVGAPAGSHYALQTYDARRTMNPTAAVRDTGNEKCVLASFASGTDVTQATVGEVVPGAVTDLQNRTNTIASEPVSGSQHTKSAGSTTGPDLTDVTLNTGDAANKRATFIFDENLNPAAYQSSNFGFYNATDNEIYAPADVTVTVSGKSATVNFGGAALDNATRFVIKSGAVQDRPQTGALGGLPVVTPSSPSVLNKAGASATKPEMTSATPIGGQEFRVVFNVPIQFTPGSAAFFLAITDDGSPAAQATAIGSGGSANTVIVTFPPSVANDPGGIVRIYLVAGGVTATGGTIANLGGQAATSTPNSVPGFTNGPDLLAILVDPATSKVAFKYDEAVADSPPPGAAAFQAAAVDGAPINAIGGVVVSGNFVTALFPPSVTSAVVFANPFNNVQDKTGRANPHQSVSKDIEVGPAAPPPPPPVAVPLPTPVPKVVPKKYKTTVTIKRRGRVYSGVVKSYRKACGRSRRVLLKRNGKRFGAAISSKKTGRYTIKRKLRLRGRVYAHAPARGKSVICRSGVSRKIRG